MKKIPKSFALHCSYCVQDSLRLDKMLSLLPLSLSRNQIHKYYVYLTINGKKAKLSDTVSYRDEIHAEFDIPKISPAEISSKNTTLRKNIKDNIIYDDEHTIILNKQRGWVVHPGVGEHDTTIAQAVFPLLQSYLETSASEHRAGIVHRLDKDTTGALLIAKTKEAHIFYANQFANRNVEKLYLSIVRGVPHKQQGDIHTVIARDKKSRKKFANYDSTSPGKMAHSHYSVLYSNKDYSVILWNIFTGRTHQIRLHAQHLGCPVLGDLLYARKFTDKTLGDVPLMLHAWKLSISLFSLDTLASTQERKEFSANIPTQMQECFEKIGYHLS